MNAEEHRIVWSRGRSQSCEHDQVADPAHPWVSQLASKRSGQAVPFIAMFEIYNKYIKGYLSCCSVIT